MDFVHAKFIFGDNVCFFPDCTCKAGEHGNEAAGSTKESGAFKRKSSTVTRKTVCSKERNGCSNVTIVLKHVAWRKIKAIFLLRGNRN